MAKGMTSDRFMGGLKGGGAKPVDASMRLPGKNIDSDSTRSKTAPSPRTLGPREA